MDNTTDAVTPTATRTDRTDRAAPDPTSLDRDPRPLFTAATTTAGEVIAGVRPEQCTAPTPCGQFDVRDLLGHLVDVLARVVAIGEGRDPMSVGVRGVAFADDAWPAAWRAAVDEADAAWRDDTALERTVVLPWATDSGANALLGYVSEITVHTWDLARATGQHPAWDDETATRALALMRNWLPGGNRAETFAEVRKQMGPEFADATAPFAEVVAVPDDASAIDRLVAWTGRRP